MVGGAGRIQGVKSMVNAVVGAKGFIGSAIIRVAKVICPDKEWIGITRENYPLWKGHKFNNVFFAGGSASKELCEDWAYAYDVNVKQVEMAVEDFSLEKFIYVSSQAVYPSTYRCPDEKVKIDEITLSNYGKSKYLGELVVKEKTPNFVVVRPNGFSGLGLTKNVIFALTRKEPYFYYTPDSYAQYIHVDRFARIVVKLSDQYNKEIINVAPKNTISPLRIADLLGINNSIIKIGNPPKVRAQINTNKLHSYLERAGEDFPTNEEAVLYWNKSLF
jgi:nucleoside-diphosphate-sugar epimerase